MEPVVGDASKGKRYGGAPLTWPLGGFAEILETDARDHDERAPRVQVRDRHAEPMGRPMRSVPGGVGPMYLDELRVRRRRRGYAAQEPEAGESHQIASRRTGRSSSATTSRYARIQPDMRSS